MIGRDAVPAASDRAVLAAAGVGWTALLAAPSGLDLPALCGRTAAGLALDPAGWPLLRALASPGAIAGGWVAMAAAMMLPLAAAQLRHVIARGGPGAPAATAAFLSGWLVVWLAALAALDLAAALLAEAFGGAAPVAALVVAVAWQHAPAKRRALRRCESCPPLPWRFGALVLSSARLGIATAARCITGCWAIMLAAGAVAPGWAAMMAAAAVVWSERYRLKAPLAFEPNWAAFRRR